MSDFVRECCQRSRATSDSTEAMGYGPAQRSVARNQSWVDIWRLLLRTVAIISVCLVAGAANARDWDPLAHYGGDLRFDVLRNDRIVGTHTLGFSHQGDVTTVESRFQIAVDVAFFTAYRYRHESRSQWRNGRLVGLLARTDDHGKVSKVEATLQGELLTVDGPAGRLGAGAGIYPTEHWNPGVLASSSVLNTITGRINKVAIVPRGRESIAIGAGTIEADRFEYTGEVRAEVWYDIARRWVRMRFAASDGSTIDYVCRSCGGAKR